MRRYQTRKIKGSAMIEYGLLAAAATIIFVFLNPIKDSLVDLFNTMFDQFFDFDKKTHFGIF